MGAELGTLLVECAGLRHSPRGSAPGETARNGAPTRSPLPLTTTAASPPKKGSAAVLVAPLFVACSSYSPSPTMQHDDKASATGGGGHATSAQTSDEAAHAVSSPDAKGVAVGGAALPRPRRGTRAKRDASDVAVCWSALECCEACVSGTGGRGRA